MCAAIWFSASFLNVEQREDSSSQVFDRAGSLFQKKEYPPLITIPIDLSTSEFSIEEDSNTPLFLSQWKEHDDIALINGAYFHEDYSASGYLVTDGVPSGDRQFDYDKSGLLLINEGRPSLLDLSTEVFDRQAVQDALQSYPFLVLDGEAAVREDSGLLARRSAIGYTRTGEWFLLVVPYRQISLFQFAQELAASDLDFERVLNLDGGPSTGIYSMVPGHEYSVNSLYQIPSIISIKKRGP